MSRYFIRPKLATWTAPPDIEDEAHTAVEYTVWPGEARDTGLLDLDGNPIMATDQVRIGFLKEETPDE